MYYFITYDVKTYTCGELTRIDTEVIMHENKDEILEELNSIIRSNDEYYCNVRLWEANEIKYTLEAKVDF